MAPMKKLQLMMRSFKKLRTSAFFFLLQEFERARFAAMESEFRSRSDEAPEQMRKIQELHAVRNSTVSLTHFVPLCDD